MNAGRKPLPTKMKVLRGTARKDRLLPNELSPKVVTLIPPPPEGLNDDGQKEWTKITRELIALGVFTKVDDSMLFTYCKEFGKYLHYERELDRVGRLLKAKSGYLMIHPYEPLAQKSLKAALQIAIQFGLTPSSRTRIAAPPKPKEDDFDKV